MQLSKKLSTAALTLAAAAMVARHAQVQAMNPADNIEGYFKVTLPYGSGSTSPVEEMVDGTFKSTGYFDTTSDGAWTIFRVPDISGSSPPSGKVWAKTSSGSYYRTELREMTSTGGQKNWQHDDGKTHTLFGDLMVTKINSSIDRKVAIGQIHATNSASQYSGVVLLLLQWVDGIVRANVRVHPGDATPSWKADMFPAAVGENFDYTIKVKSRVLTISGHSFDTGASYSGSVTLATAWDTEDVYFKAGAYVLNNDGNGECQFWWVSASHV